MIKLTKYERNIERLKSIDYLSDKLLFEISDIEDDYNLKDYSVLIKEIKSNLKQINRLSEEQFFFYDDYLDMKKYSERVSRISNCTGFYEKNYKDIANKIQKLDNKISNLEMD